MTTRGHNTVDPLKDGFNRTSWDQRKHDLGCEEQYEEPEGQVGLERKVYMMSVGLALTKPRSSDRSLLASLMFS
ncbi:hypothetical protein E1301_Tti006490 [Triplophysa tibetana]|uniref:Uncharacterized protein n=1 Tax=Triplophysa tibetana TaxID=1572043 RepID=A0A5A9NXV9_9TELE|nr:hypothetical protein E1301_Tti006490 [Triplophysa tibetana]